MRKTIIIFSLFMLFTLNMGTLSFAATMQTPNLQPVEQGLYDLKDLHLFPNIKYNVHNESSTETMYLLVFDTAKKISQFISIKPQERITLVKPIEYGFSIVVVGAGKLTFYA